MQKRKINWLNPFLNFVAVILGVYLAFYINENARATDEMEESVNWMNALKNDLTGDIETYESYHIPMNNQHVDNIGKLLTILSSDSLDQLSEHLPTLFQVENFVPTNSTYSSMKSSGKLELIQDLDLQKLIIDYYENDVEESSHRSDYQIEYFFDELIHWLTEHADLTNLAFDSEEQLTTFKNKLIIYQSLIEQKVSSYQVIVDESKALASELDTYLANQSE